MKKLNINNFQYLTVFYLVITISIFTSHIFRFISSSLFKYFTHSVYAIIWISILLVIYIYYFKIKDIESFAYILGFVFAGYVLLIPSILLRIVAFDTNKLIEKKYIGTYGIVNGTDVNDMEVSVDNRTYVYKITDTSYQKELANLEKHFGDEIYDEQFIFWQTAYAYGYEPKNIYEYPSSSSLQQKTTLLFTIGPLFIIETFIKAMLDALILMIFPFIGLLFKKQIFIDEINDLVKSLRSS